MGGTHPIGMLSCCSDFHVKLTFFDNTIDTVHGHQIQPSILANKQKFWFLCAGKAIVLWQDAKVNAKAIQ